VQALSLQRELAVVQQRFDEATREVTVLEKLSARLDMQSGVKPIETHVLSLYIAHPRTLPFIEARTLN
jgi:hypothetical protein